MSEKKLSVCQRKKQELFGRLSALEVFKEKYNASEEQQQIAVRKEWLEETREEFLKTMEKIKDLDTTIDIQKGIEEEADFMSRYFNIKGFLLSQMGSDTAIMNASALNTTICNAGQSNNLHLRLPKIELPVFDGDATKWLTFRDRFTAMIHVSSEIPAVMKLQYLVASLRGEAAARFEHTSITADNYIITWNALLKRYDNKRSLIREYIRALHMMPSMRSECVDSLVQLVDDFIRHVKGLEKLNEPVDQWDTPLCALLFLKLDDASLLAWENHSVLHATTSTKDKYAELLEFLQDRIRILKSRIRPSSSSSSVHVRAKVAGETTGRSENGRNRSSRAVAVPVQNHAEAMLVSVKCLLCGSNHTIYKCSLFEAMNIQERYNIATSKKLCFNCLLSGHTVQACRSKFTCKSCHKRHHSMLCNVKERTFDDHRKSATLTCHSKNQSSTTNASKFVFLSTVQLWVSDQNGRRILARGLLDSGSQTNFMSERLAQQLQLSRTSANVPVAGIGEVATTVRHKVSAKLSSQHTAFEIALSFLVIKRPTIDLPAVDVDTSRWLIPENIQLADPTFSKVGRIDFILGAEVFFDLMLDGKVSLASNLPTLINTKFGWILSGSCYPKHQTSIAACASSIICKEEENINALMEAFFRVEEVQDQDVMSAEERECEQLFQATTTRDPDGKYIVRLPFKDDPTSALGDSKTTAERRFLAVERRLNREPQTKEAYIAFMKEYEQLGHMSKINEDETSIEDDGCYLPHHPVFKQESTTTKCRVVFDASCKTESGKSLNDILKVGPTIQEEGTSILIRFRTYTVALVADIQKMYRQIWVHEEDRKYQKILWRTNASEPITKFKLNTVTYGTASAPFLAVRALKQTVQDHGAKFPLAARHFNDFYVDDFITGESDETTARSLREQAEKLFEKGGFQLRKWASNVSAVIDDVDTENQAISIQEATSKNFVTTLGMIWEPHSDILRIKVNTTQPTARFSKRSVVACIAKIYDPLGLIDPIKAKAKQFLQRIWMLRKEDGDRWSWDDNLPQAYQEEWLSFYDQLSLLEEVRIPRLTVLPHFANIQMHIFCDASEKGYGACCYLRSRGADGKIAVNLLTSKSKVASLSIKHTIARLELCAAHLASRLFKAVAASTKSHAKIAHFWSDSTTVLHWLNASPNTWKTFVANRVSKILQTTKYQQWSHVPGSCNPADLVSRGMKPEEIVHDQLWWHGPEWLAQSEEYWPQADHSSADLTDCENERKPTATFVIAEREPHPIFHMYSSYSKLRRIVAVWMRYFKILQRKPVEGMWISISDLNAADRALCRLSQGDVFQDDIEALQKGRSLPNKSTMKWLNPKLHSDGVIRIGGRLGNSAETFEQKHPIILHSSHPFVQLLAQYYHVKLLHAGPQLMSCTIRNKYWIIRGRSLIKRTFHQCIRCFRCKPVAVEQPMADLPASRVTQSRPFSITGVDFCGPVFVKGTHRRAVPTKAYVAVFVCFVTRAVHLELVSDLTTSAFLAALRRFVARRGAVSEIHSDNGTNFKGASHELNRIYTLIHSHDHQQAVSAWTLENEIQWKFIPPRAPHFGGLWEAAVRSLKHHLVRVMKDTPMTFEGLSTLLSEIEACLNSRPLTELSNDPTSYDVLTPGHFLVGSNMRLVPDIQLTDIQQNRLNHWHIVQQKMQHIWNRWRVEYLQQLQIRRKWISDRLDILPGMLIILKEDNVPPSRWPLGRIVKTHPGKDGTVRVVTVRTASQELVRPIAKICLLPCNKPDNVNNCK